MTEPTRTSPLGALDSFFSVIRSKAADDVEFARDLTRALNVPIEFCVDAADAGALLPFIDPVVLAGEGLDKFRNVVGHLKDADVRKIITNNNLASKDELVGKRGVALKDLLWEAASEKRKRLVR
jgi:hypothetical protein